MITPSIVRARAAGRRRRRERARRMQLRRAFMRRASRRARGPGGRRPSATSGVVGDEDDRPAGRVELVEDRRSPPRRRRLSRLPVGSSARRSAGSVTRARAIADALLLAAGQLGRLVVQPVAQPQPLERGRAPAPARSRRGDALVEERRGDVLQRGRARQQVVGLEDEADRPAAQRRPARRRRARPRPCRRAGTCRCVGRSRQPMMFMSVDLPEPDGPTMATNSPSADGQVDAAQGLHADAAHVVDTTHGLQLEERRRHGGPPAAADREAEAARRWSRRPCAGSSCR